MSNQIITQQSTATQHSHPHFLGIVYGELMKITWLRIVWIMAAFVVSIMALFFLFLLFDSTKNELLRQNPVEYGYDIFLGQSLLVFRALTGFFAIILTVYAIGQEYQQGTIRILLGRGVSRTQFLLGKLVALFLVAIIVQILGFIFNALLLVVASGVGTGSLHAFSTLLANDGGVIEQYFLYMVVNMWASILLAATITIVGRSLTLGLSISLLWFPLDNIASTLLGLASKALPGNILPIISSYLLGPNLNILPKLIFKKGIIAIFVPATTVNSLHSLIVIAIYAVGCFIIALLSMRAQEVRA